MPSQGVPPRELLTAKVAPKSLILPIKLFVPSSSLEMSSNFVPPPKRLTTRLTYTGWTLALLRTLGGLSTVYNNGHAPVCTIRVTKNGVSIKFAGQSTTVIGDPSGRGRTEDM